MGFSSRNYSRRMHLVPVTFLLLLSESLACRSGSTSYGGTAVVCRLTKPAALVLNQQTAEVIQTAFHNAKYPDIKGERSVRFLGKIAYGLTNIHIHGLTIEKSEVDFKEDVAIAIGIQNVSASFRGTLSYGYVGAWVVKLIHSIDFEIKSAIDLQLDIKLTCEKERVLVETPDCYLNFHELILHLQGDKNPGWLKQLFTNFISFTLKLVLKNQVCKEINIVSQGLADFVQDTAANFLQDGNIGVDLSLASFPVIKANYVESHHKGLLLYKNYSGFGHETVFAPSLLTESRMLYFWFSGHVLNSVVSAAFLDGRLELAITGDKLKEMFENEELETHREIVHKFFQGASGNDSTARVWSLDAPQVVLQPEGTVVKSSVAVELSVSSQGNEPSVVLYFEQDVTVTIQASYVQERLVLQLLKAIIKPKALNCAPHIRVDDETLWHSLENIIKVAGIPEVISRIEAVLTSMLDSRGVYLFDLHNPEIITKEGYFIIQMDFGFPHHILTEFLNRTL